MIQATRMEFPHYQKTVTRLFVEGHGTGLKSVHDYLCLRRREKVLEPSVVKELIKLYIDMANRPHPKSYSPDITAEDYVFIMQHAPDMMLSVL